MKDTDSHSSLPHGSQPDSDEQLALAKEMLAELDPILVSEIWSIVEKFGAASAIKAMSAIGIVEQDEELDD